MSSRKPSSTQAEVVLLPTLKNCLLNLPSTLVSALLNSNTLAQNVVVELSWRQAQQQASAAQAQRDAKQKPPSVQRSVFLGWTGMGSQRKEGGLVGRDGVKSGGSGETVEVDATFARLVGLADGTKVRKSEDFEDAFGRRAWNKMLRGGLCMTRG